MKDDLQSLLTETKRICEAATPGEWRWLRDSLVADHGHRPVVLAAQAHEGYPSMVECRDGLLEDLDTSGPNAAFIAHARTALPRLVAALELAVSQRDAVTISIVSLEQLGMPIEHKENLIRAYTESRNLELARVLRGEP